MNNQIVPQVVVFNNQELLTFEQNGVQYTAMKPICENIGIDWDSQRKRILRDDVLSQAVVMITTPSKGGLQKMLSLPIKMLNGWLFGVDSKRVKTEKAKEYLLKYKMECFEALYNYWHKGEAVNPRTSNPKTTTDERTPLRQAVTALVGKAKIKHDEAYRMVHQFMGVDSIDQIPLEDLPKAVAYVHSLTLVVGRASHPLDAYALTNLKALVTHNFLMVSFYKTIEQPIKALNPSLWSHTFEHFWSAKSLAIGFNNQFDLGVDERYLLPYRC